MSPCSRVAMNGESVVAKGPQKGQTLQMDVKPMPLRHTVVQPAAHRYGPTENKLSRTKDPDRWRLMSRLVPPAKPGTPRAVIRGDWDTTSRDDGHVIPEKKGFTCSCPKRSLHVTKSIWKTGRPLSGKLILQKSDYGFVKGVERDFKENASPQFPLSTIVVSWRADRVLYNLESLHRLLSLFGTIVRMRHIRTNSVVVVFDDLSHACRLVAIRNMVARVNQLYCTWWHRCMESKHFNLSDGLRVYQNVYLHY